MDFNTQAAEITPCFESESISLVNTPSLLLTVHPDPAALQWDGGEIPSDSMARQPHREGPG